MVEMQEASESRRRPNDRPRGSSYVGIAQTPASVTACLQRMCRARIPEAKRVGERAGEAVRLVARAKEESRRPRERSFDDSACEAVRGPASDD